MKSLCDFYNELADGGSGVAIPVLDKEPGKDIGHFNVFNLAELIAKANGNHVMPYDRRTYYKISLVRGHARAEYADKVVNIETQALLFASPRIPYNWVPQNDCLSGYFCVFTPDFMSREKTGSSIDALPIFQPGGKPLFTVPDSDFEEIEGIFKKMNRELASDYAFKYDLIRNLVMELVHYGQKLQPATAIYSTQNAAGRVSSLFIELLERQFPIESIGQRLALRTAKDYADKLAVHVNHLNKVLKETTGRTTTDIISSRIINEAQVLLRQTSWNISEIAYSLGFDEMAYFSNFFRKQTGVSPLHFRS